MNDEDKMDLASLAEIIAEMQARHGKGLMEEDDEEETELGEKKPKGSLAMIVSKSVGKPKDDESEEDY